MITGELLHNLVVVDVEKKQKKKTEWKPEGQKHNEANLRDEPYRQLIERVKEIMSNNNLDLWGLFKESVLMACNEVCGYTKNMTCNVDMWWWNNVEKDEIQEIMEACKEMIKIPLMNPKMNTED